MEFRILGPLEVYEEGRAVPLTGKPRSLLAVLLLEPRTMLPRERVIDDLWGDEPPETAAKAVQVFAARLRKALPNLPLVTRGSAYRLDVERDQIDRDRFDDHVAAAREAAASNNPEDAAHLLREALELWRGPPLADVTEPFARAAAATLDAQRLAALEERIDADLALGHHRELVPELQALSAEYPVQERFQAQLMLALYRSGRQAEALDVYTEARRTLVDEFGLEPSRELQRLQQQILAQDPSLDVPTKPAPEDAVTAPRHRRRAIVAAALVAVSGAVATAGVILLTRAGATTITLTPRSVMKLDGHTERVIGQIPLGATPIVLTADPRGAWAATAEGTVVHLDATRNRVDATGTIDFPPNDLAALAGSAWVSSRLGPLVVRVSRRYERSVARISLPQPSDRVGAIGSLSPRLTVGNGSVWIAEGQTTVLRLDPRTNHITRRVMPTSGASGAISYGAGAVWVAGANAVARISPESGVVVSTINLEGTPNAMVYGDGALWIALAGASSILRVDGYADTVTATIPIGAKPTGIAAATHSIWVLAGHTLARIDTATNRVTRRIRLNGRATALAGTPLALWIASA
jgi:DNA-binding SARP family transcriptional activator